MKTIEVRYFAVLREQAGCAAEGFATAAGTPAALWMEVQARHGFRLPRSALRVAINDEFAGWEQPLRPGDRVAFLPPVAGG